MSALVLNRDTFSLPSDRWYLLAPLGEFPHGDWGLVQVVDSVVCETLAAGFVREAKGEHFAGVLIDFDHFSQDSGCRFKANQLDFDFDVRTSLERL